MDNSWLVVEPYPSEKYEFVNWDDDIPTFPTEWKNHKVMFQTTNQDGIHGTLDGWYVIALK